MKTIAIRYGLIVSLFVITSMNFLIPDLVLAQIEPPRDYPHQKWGKILSMLELRQDSSEYRTEFPLRDRWYKSRSDGFPQETDFPDEIYYEDRRFIDRLEQESRREGEAKPNQQLGATIMRRQCNNLPRHLETLNDCPPVRLFSADFVDFSTFVLLPYFQFRGTVIQVFKDLINGQTDNSL